MLEPIRRTGSCSPGVISKIGQFRSPHIACPLEEKPRALGPFYLVSMLGEVKLPMQGIDM